MIGGILSVGERLAGQKDPRFYRGLLFAVGESAAIAASYGLLFGFLGKALDKTLTRNDILLFSGALVGTLLVQAVLARPAFVGVFTATFALMGQARIRLLDHLRRLPMGFFTLRRSGDLAGTLTTDIALVEDIWAHLFALFAAGLILPVFVGAWLCLIDWRLGLAVLITLPLALLVLAATMPILTRHAGKLLDAASNTNAGIVEYVQGIAVLRTFGRHGEGFKRLGSSVERLRDAQISAEVKPSPLIAAYGFTIEMSFVLVALLGSYLMLGGSLDAKTLLLFLLVSVSVSRRLFDFGVALLQLRTAQSALSRIEGLFAEKPLAEPAASAAAIERFDVEVEDASFAYDAEQVLRNINAKFPERKLTALVGPSGSGKSTLVHLIARLWDLERGQGTIRIGGVDIRNVPFEKYHEHISMVFQDVVLFSGSILENIRVGNPGASPDQVIAAAKAAQAHEFISRLPDGYDTPVGEGGNTLSGGEKQRISIARAILKDAPIVLLDEATASIDASAESEIQHAIDELVKKKTVIVIAHRLKTVQRADQILVLEKGNIVERGTHAELLEKRGVYARLWSQQERARGWHVRSQEQVPA